MVASGSLYTAANKTESYAIIFTSTLSTISEVGVGINGFEALVTFSFSPNITILRFNSTLVEVAITVAGDTALTFFSVNTIAFGSINYASTWSNCIIFTYYRFSLFYFK